MINGSPEPRSCSVQHENVRTGPVSNSPRRAIEVMTTCGHYEGMPLCNCTVPFFEVPANGPCIISPALQVPGEDMNMMVLARLMSIICHVCSEPS